MAPRHPGSRIASGLPANKVAGTLTEPEWTQLCRAFEDGFLKDPALEQGYCRSLGVVVAAFALDKGAMTDAELQMVCKQAVDGCKPEPPMPEMCTGLPRRHAWPRWVSSRPASTT